YRSFDDLSQLFERAQIEYSPEFFASETNDKFLVDLQVNTEIETRRLLYVAMTRPRDKLILEWPSYLEGKDSHTYWSNLVEQTGLMLDGETLVTGEKTFPCKITKGNSEFPRDFNPEDMPTPKNLPATGRRAIQAEVVPGSLTPDSVTPSGLVVEGVTETDSGAEIFQYSSGLEINLDMAATELGTFLHRCFEVVGVNPSLMDKLLAVTGIDLEEKNRESILSDVGGFETWL
ncbi:MAG: hypothetical protein GY703_17280, partial [Gammaproteobacteria bacterium]|nr:hypothetical protein [Gammaproteobacteria bacterium]